MWHVLAEEEIRCTECNHQIPSGADCLSQLPPRVPENFRRSKFKTFCISCTRCDQTGSGRTRKGLHPLEDCYVRHLTIRIGHTPDQKMTEGPVPCAYCGQTIRRNTKAFVQEIYAWPEHYRESAGKSTNGSGASVGASSGAAGFRLGSDGWHRLSPETRRLFQTRGLGRGVRPDHQQWHCAFMSGVSQEPSATEATVPSGVFLRGRTQATSDQWQTRPNEPGSPAISFGRMRAPIVPGIVEI